METGGSVSGTGGSTNVSSVSGTGGSTSEPSVHELYERQLDEIYKVPAAAGEIRYERRKTEKRVYAQYVIGVTGRLVRKSSTKDKYIEWMSIHHPEIVIPRRRARYASGTPEAAAFMKSLHAKKSALKLQRDDEKAAAKQAVNEELKRVREEKKAELREALKAAEKEVRSKARERLRSPPEEQVVPE